MRTTTPRYIIVLVCFLCASCATVPLTGRRQLALISNQSLLSMSYRQYDEFLKANKLSGDQTQTQRVKSVGQRIQQAVERYMAANNLADELRDYEWEFNLVENEEANAWCMPGGKVMVYTGILPVTKDEDGLAVVMAHEIAHAIARHGDERMSQGLLTELGGVALSSALEKQTEKTKKIWMTAFGVGTQFGVLLPYSRLQENEADRLGLIFMAMAGFDPHAAVAFWERMLQKKDGQPDIEFLSTHPSGQTRIQNIKAAIPEAMQYRTQAPPMGGFSAQ
ncbi:MAG: M48 family metallopeptidase [Candidatus Omnitrophica bacterium]|nr:M48 family metallopeptidase [Candidatus Omnitrophota bacterium]